MLERSLTHLPGFPARTTHHRPERCITESERAPEAIDDMSLKDLMSMEREKSESAFFSSAVARDRFGDSRSACASKFAPRLSKRSNLTESSVSQHDH